MDKESEFADFAEPAKFIEAISPVLLKEIHLESKCNNWSTPG
jgi:hypothetical protein